MISLPRPRINFSLSLGMGLSAIWLGHTSGGGGGGGAVGQLILNSPPLSGFNFYFWAQ